MPSDFIDKVRESASIERLAGEVTKLSGRGQTLQGVCPFHTEDTPSFTVFVEDNRWKCFGCGRGGSVFDFVMEREKLEFWDAVLYLAGKCGIPVPNITEEEKTEHIKREQVETLLSQYAAACHRALKSDEKALEYLKGRGVTDESIEAYGIGVGVSLTKNVDKALAKESGISDTRLVGRIIFPIQRGGKVVQVSARTLSPEDKRKYIWLSRELYPFNSHRLRAERVVLVEGVLDAILLEQAGFQACATGVHFKRDWLRLIRKETNCYAAFDQDDSGAGETANESVSDLLFEGGHKAFVVKLPEGHDPASLIQVEGAGRFQELLDCAKSYIDYLIDRLPPSLNSYDLPKELTGIYEKLAKLPTTSHERYTSKLAEKLKLSRMAIRAELKDYLRSTKKRDDASDGDSGEWKIRRRATNPTFFNPSQDYIKDTLYYSVYFEIEGLGAFKPFILTSNKECYPFSREELLKRDMICRTAVLPSNMNRWSIGTDNPYNALDYLDGKTHIDPKDLYQKIRWYFRKFTWLPDPFYYDFLTCWTMATYHYRLYDSFGYIFINAMKRSGKTQTLSILSHLAFNASMADALTEAVLKRRVNVDAATIIADEAEYFKAKLKDEKSMVFEVFNGGYKRTGRATMVDADTKAVEDFCTFSPKALANTQGLYDVLADRCITLYLLRSEYSVPQFVEAEHAGKLQVLRDMLYCFTLEYIAEIAEARKDLKQPENLPGRDWELWVPVLTMASFLDAYKVVEPEEFELSDGTKKVIDSLFDRMVMMAVERREYRKALEEELQPEPRIMQAIWQYIQENREPDEMYRFRDVQDFIKESLGWDKYSSKSFSTYIYDTTKLARRNNKDDRQESWTTTTDGKRKKLIKIRLREDLVKERARQLFGLELKVDESYSSNLFDGERDPFEDD